LILSTPKLGQLIRPDCILELNAADKEEALRILSEKCAEDERVLDGEAFLRAIIRREEQVSTGVGMGIAIPHVKIPEVTDYVAAVGRSKEGIPFDSLDGEPVHLIFMIGASDRQTREFVRILAQVTHLLKPEATRRELLKAPIPGPFLDVIRSHD
jgi:mannitol/fructose-specific phosphotransferase system IIA component (Ntr-type)